MSKLLEDEKVAKLVNRETAKAVKAERKRVLDLLKEAKDENKETEDKAAKKAIAALLKDLTNDVRNPAAGDDEDEE